MKTVDPQLYAHALLIRQGNRPSGWKGITMAMAETACREWDRTNGQKPQEIPKRQVAKSSPAKTEARAHVDAVKTAREEAIQKRAEIATGIRRRRELNVARNVGLTAEVQEAATGIDDWSATRDAEADQAEAQTRGENKSTAKKGGSVLAQHEAMPPGPERIAFWNKNKRAIMAQSGKPSDADIALKFSSLKDPAARAKFYAANRAALKRYGGHKR